MLWKLIPHYALETGVLEERDGIDCRENEGENKEDDELEDKKEEGGEEEKDEDNSTEFKSSLDPLIISLP